MLSEAAKRNLRNMNPHAEAVLAMLVWGKRYSEQKGGSMDFWDSLSRQEQAFCREQVDRIFTLRLAALRRAALKQEQE
jgi:hypothetical protein